eukprot:gnl/TRDRNA2_/TRDRNA2_199774_c0_seq1.p1 gnl/TRDRNA2_/TRDRNA2_199774_c0~~gnl/TRDRNA2_/TRDRNA2_199774_c0_seq1.p1  ORF type:complete len:366 (+),score=56.72 gnl/TRDRNA2_/TRDRNA2_199774_c0_seq1:91-1188(+)
MPTGSTPFAGHRSDIPAPRERTPSPVSKAVQDSSGVGQAPLRDFNIDFSKVDVIYAEDEEVFRETAIRVLLKTAVIRDNIYESENGIGALEHLARLQSEGHQTMPLVVLLDVRMPGMDGRECAFQIQELVKKRVLRREPFVICISSLHRQVIVDEGKGNFQVVLPKPFTLEDLNESFALVRKWWCMGSGRKLAAWKPFDHSMLDLIVAADEPVCRMSALMAFTSAGIQQEYVTEVEDEESICEALREAQQGDRKRPLLLVIGHIPWAPGIRNFVDTMKRESIMEGMSEAEAVIRDPFVICTSIDSDRTKPEALAANFHAFLPTHFNQADVKWCLELCRLWWLTRGDGGAGSDSEDEASEASEASA